MRLNDSRGKREKGERDSEFVRSRLTILWSISRHSSTGYTLEPRESSRIKVKRTEWTHGENTGVDIELAVYLPSRMEYCGETFQTECRSLSLSLFFTHTHTHTHILPPYADRPTSSDCRYLRYYIRVVRPCAFGKRGLEL